MNKLSILFVLLFGILTVKAQSYKIYIDNYGAKADSINAKSYMVVTRVSDTDWLAKQYLMNNIIKCLGTYKDQNLTTPNGKFTYYNQNKSQGVDAKNADTINYVQMSGYFIDGLKTGTWTTYFKNGNIEYINNYKNDKLNGLYESYNYDSNTILIKGYYADNKRNGEWDTFNPHGDIIEANIIKDDNLVSSHTVKISYIGAEPRYGLYDYLDKNLKSLVSSNYGGKISVDFKLLQMGKLKILG
jgi:antitoxin component YwqK of YwqJK toxin-antitoxin module